MKCISSTSKNFPPDLYFRLNGAVIISPEFAEFVASWAAENTETEEESSLRNYEDRRGNFIYEAEYEGGYAITVTGEVLETWKFHRSHDRDTRSEWELLSRNVEIEEVECYDSDGEWMPCEFEKETIDEVKDKLRNVA